MVRPWRGWSGRGRWLPSGRGRWLPLIAVLWHPSLWIVAGFVGVVLLVWTPIRKLGLQASIYDNRVTRVVVMAGWLVVAVLGLSALLADSAKLI